MSLTYLTPPDGSTTDLLQMAATNTAYREAWLMVVKATLSVPSQRARFAGLVTRHRDALHAIAALSIDPTFLADIVQEDTQSRSNLPTFRENPNLFCPVWADLFGTATGTAHDTLKIMEKVGDLDTFFPWALKHAQRGNPNHNRVWTEHFIPQGAKAARRARKAKNQRARGRTLGPVGGTQK